MTPDPQPSQTHLPVLPETQLAVSCEGCGICCTEVPVPPYLDEIDFIPEELQRQVYEARLIEEQLIADKRPCIWWDPATKKCSHYEDRPNICREYETGGELCLETRTKYRIV